MLIPATKLCVLQRLTESRNEREKLKLSVCFFQFLRLPPPPAGRAGGLLRRLRGTRPGRPAQAAKIVEICLDFVQPENISKTSEKHPKNVRKRPKNVRKRPETSESDRKRSKTCQNVRKLLKMPENTRQRSKTSENVRNHRRRATVQKCPTRFK